MADHTKHLTGLDKITDDYRRADAARQAVREAAVAAIVAALRAGVPPTVVTAHCPFTAAYVRVLARNAGIPAAPPGPKR